MMVLPTGYRRQILYKELDYKELHELQVTGGQGIIVDTEGVRVLTASNGGLAFTGLTLQVDASKTSNKGGGPSNNDEFIIADSSDSDAIKNLTYSQIKTAITDSIASPAITSYTNSGNNRLVTSVNSSTVNGEANLTFDGSLLSVSGNLSVSGAADTPTLFVKPGGASFGKVGINNSDLGVTLTVTDNGAAATLGLHRTSSAFYIDGDDIGDVAFVGSALGEVLSVSSRIRVEADGSEWNNTSYPSRMSFWTTPTGSSSAIQRMVINNSGNVGIGITGSAPNSRLHLSGNFTVQATNPSIHFSSSVGEDLAEIGVNDSANILIQNNTTNKHIVFKTNDAGSMKEGLRIDGAVPEVVVNQGSDSLIDFRVESNNNTHMLMVDGSGDKVGINVDVPTHTLTVVGDVFVENGLSGSGGIHATGSNPHIAIGDSHGQGPTAGMLQIRPSDTSNKVLCLMQAKEDEGMRTCFAVTGSGQVLVGGNHFGGVLNISGSDIERLISAKSDSEDPAFYVSGSGDAALSGRLAFKSDGTTDPVTLANHAHIYAKDVASSAEVFVRDEAGNITQISPHTPEGEWQYFSRNTRTGKVVRVNMEKMIRKLEEFTGESFMEEWYEEPID